MAKTPTTDAAPAPQAAPDQVGAQEAAITDTAPAPQAAPDQVGAQEAAITDTAPAAQAAADQLNVQQTPSNDLALATETNAISVLQAQMETVYTWMNEVAHVLARAGLVSVPEAVPPEAPADEAQA